jgi:hypothetical protein
MLILDKFLKLWLKFQVASSLICLVSFVTYAACSSPVELGFLLFFFPRLRFVSLILNEV